MFKLKKNQLILYKEDLKKLTRSNNKILAIKKCLQLVSKCTYAAPAYEYRKVTSKGLETNNIFKFVNNYMYGYCHEICFLFKFLLKINKIEARFVRLVSKKYPISHWVVECMYKKNWILIDPTLGMYFKNKSKTKYLSLEDIKKINKNEIVSNKKISLKKMAVTNKKKYFYFNKKKSFTDPRKKYFSYFNFSEFPAINDNKYAYKKKLIKNHNLNDFMKYEAINFKGDTFEIKKSNLKYGLQNGKIVNSSKFVNFKNFIYKKKINKNLINIKNFPFPILDIRLKTNNGKNIISTNINESKFKILYKKKRLVI